jgi:hypothetical protein
LIFVCFAEAHSLAESGGNSRGADKFSMEAVRTLLTEVENNKFDTVVVLAGYKDKMKQLIRMDEGLKRRFPGEVHLSDYTPDELAKIARHYAKDKMQLDFEEVDLEARLAKQIEEQHSIRMNNENASLAIHLVDDALTRRADRKRKVYLSL